MLKPWERWVGLIAFLIAAMCCVGCASGNTRVLNHAVEIPHFEAMYLPTPGDDMAAGLLALTARLESWGVRIEHAPPDVPIYGRALTVIRDGVFTRVIQVRPGLSINGRFEVLAHEAGHLLQPPGLKDAAVGQLFAELVGVGVGRFYGANPERAAAAYLAAFKYVFGAEKYLRRDIDYAVQALTGQRPLP